MNQGYTGEKDLAYKENYNKKNRQWHANHTTPYKGNYYDNYNEYNSRGQYDTPSALINKMNEQPHDLAHEFLDMEMQMRERRPFTREDFRQMINKTYLEFYGKFKDQFNPEEYMQCVD